MKLPYWVGELDVATMRAKLGKRPLALDHQRDPQTYRLALILERGIPEEAADLYSRYRYFEGALITRIHAIDPRLVVLTRLYQRGRPKVQVIKMLSLEASGAFNYFDHLSFYADTVITRCWESKDVPVLWEFRERLSS